MARHELKPLLEAYLSSEGESPARAQELIEVISAHATGRRRDVSSVLYHYTDASGLLGILTSQKLWLTHASFLNDPGEHSYARALVASCLDELSRRSEIHATVIARLRRSLELFVENDEVFLISFCDIGDVLSQWRGYGAVGAGFAVGFDAAELGQLPHRPWGGLYPVEYLNSFDESPLYPVIDILCEVIHETGATQLPARGGALASALSVFMAIHLLRCKHPAFAAEREWRFVNLAGRTGKLEEVKWRATAGEIRPYVEVPLTEANGRLPLRKIVCGPTTDSARAEKSLTMLLRQFGLDDVEVTTSTIPFRMPSG